MKTTLRIIGVSVFTMIYTMMLVWFADQFELYYSTLLVYVMIGGSAALAYQTVDFIEFLISAISLIREHRKRRTYITKELG